ncbi:hypothetical protein [Methylococcus sp. EFPC2]|uniref:hypothetical protein n=1 Tax=Methylococcus sp. EFPC2 TaxID=2812648 RepID=UPI00196882DD|nr:hypothetical protein [Methylococcus sp. EFPC2]QSA98402.1 hypothetical protein JWZ97_06230 [Methylococcus sp. EFPC2]
MAEFVLNQDVVTDASSVEVTLNADRPLPLGRHRFRLIVVDDAGNRSVPDEVVVIIADQSAPTAILNAPSVAAFGNSFTLDGSRSFDVGGGRIVSYTWTYLGPSLVIGPVTPINPVILDTPVTPVTPVGPG